MGGAGILALAIMSVPLTGLRANPPAGPAPEGGSTSVNTNMSMPLAAHRAVYELTLLKSTGTKSPTAARGRIAFDFSGSPCDGYVQNFRQLTELQPAEGPTRVSDMRSATFEDGDGKSFAFDFSGSPCDGYVQNFRQLTELQPAEGPTRVSDMRSATFEDGDGKSFAFDMKTNVDNAESDVIDGKASKANDGALSIALSKPKPGKLNLDTDVVFPTEHLRRILAAAEDGKNMLALTVYDGSETGDKLYETTTIIGHPILAPVVEQAAHIPPLENMKRWPVSISYFEAGKKDEGPNYILSFDLYENGISRALKLDYGDFVLGGEMTSLELLPQKTCAK